MVQHDYMVMYEGECDPYTESCFLGCEDDDCQETYHYSIIERHANELFSRCGQPDVLECDAAWECQHDAQQCSVTYCNPEIDGSESCVALEDYSFKESGS